MLTKSTEAVKPLRPRFLAKNNPLQIDCAEAPKSSLPELPHYDFFSAPLYQFALRIPLPAAEKLIFILVSSYYSHFEKSSNFWPNIFELASASNIATERVERIMRSLLKEGVVVEDNELVFAVHPVIPLLNEYHNAISYDYLHARLTDEKHAFANAISRSIEVQKLRYSDSKLKPDSILNSLISSWREMEVGRKLLREKRRNLNKFVSELTESEMR